MKTVRHLCVVFALISFFISQETVSAQKDSDYCLELSGKILEGDRSDITVFQEIDDDWRVIRTMRLRFKYNLELNLKYNHYVIFQRRDGLTRSVYINKSEAGKWAMNFDVSFSDFCTKNVSIHKNTNTNDFGYKINKISNQKIVITKAKKDSDLITIKE